MKILKLVIFPLLIISVSCSQNPYEVEDALYDCMVNEYTKHDVDLDVELEKFESYLIEEKIIENESGEEYALLYSKMTGFPPMKITIDHNYFDNLYVVELEELISENCLLSLDSSVIKKSKVFHLEQELIRYSLNQNTTEFSSVFEVYESVIGVEEYKHPYYKSKVLLSVLYLANIEAGIPEVVPGSKPIKSYDGYENIEIELREDKIVNIDGGEWSLDQLKDTLVDFIEINKPDYTITLCQTSKTSYGLYMETHNVIDLVINKFRDDVSNELFGVPYAENSNEIQQIKLKEMFPKVIFEPNISK